MAENFCTAPEKVCKHLESYGKCNRRGYCPDQALNISIKGAVPDASTRKDILNKAIQCVCTDRERQYGTPEDNFRIIADLWSVYLSDEDFKIYLTAHDVAMMMCLLKIGRIASRQAKADNYIDLAGYAAVASEIALKEDKQ